MDCNAKIFITLRFQFLFFKRGFCKKIWQISGLHWIDDDQCRLKTMNNISFFLSTSSYINLISLKLFVQQFDFFFPYRLYNSELFPVHRHISFLNNMYFQKKQKYLKWKWSGVKLKLRLSVIYSCNMLYDTMERINPLWLNILDPFHFLFMSLKISWTKEKLILYLLSFYVSHTGSFLLGSIMKI